MRKRKKKKRLIKPRIAGRLKFIIIVVLIGFGFVWLKTNTNDFNPVTIETSVQYVVNETIDKGETALDTATNVVKTVFSTAYKAVTDRFTKPADSAKQNDFYVESEQDNNKAVHKIEWTVDNINTISSSANTVNTARSGGGGNYKAENR